MRILSSVAMAARGLGFHARGGKKGRQVGRGWQVGRGGWKEREGAVAEGGGLLLCRCLFVEKELHGGADLAARGLSCSGASGAWGERWMGRRRWGWG